jgi:hypothetical protein
VPPELEPPHADEATSTAAAPSIMKVVSFVIPSQSPNNLHIARDRSTRRVALRRAAIARGGAARGRFAIRRDTS